MIYATSSGSTRSNVCYSSLLVLATLLPSRSAAQSDALQVDNDAWHARRLQALRAEDGWLNLAGLFWLQEGANTFGSGKDNNLSFPTGQLPSQAGTLVREGFRVTLHLPEGSPVRVDGMHETSAIVFDTGASHIPILSCGSLRWSILRRSERLGIRLRDLEHPALLSFTGVERFAVNAQWVVPAKLLPHPVPKNIPITNILGQTNLLPSPGQLTFSRQGKVYTLDVLEEGEELFILFGDASNGAGSYVSGRFLYAPKPGPDGLVLLDFNRAINPPCAFTPFATCHLPPPQNRLPMAVTAGEKDVHGSH
ncbi:MAG: DUF1684 domain-containing protein [Bacteroidetes bacterium]|nr:DUF1684 domain-containing protein [Bacteroidota bacterium]